MNIFAILLGLFVLAATAFLVIQPLMDRKLERQPLLTRQKMADRDHQRSILLAERERVLNALSELEQDFAEGKVEQADHAQQRSALMQAGADILRSLDTLGESPIDGKSGSEKARPVIAPTPGEDELEALIAARRKDRSERSAGFCAKCGYPLQKSDKFCPHCGAANGD